MTNYQTGISNCFVIYSGKNALLEDSKTSLKADSIVSKMYMTLSGHFLRCLQVFKVLNLV